MKKLLTTYPMKTGFVLQIPTTPQSLPPSPRSPRTRRRRRRRAQRPPRSTPSLDGPARSRRPPYSGPGRHAYQRGSPGGHPRHWRAAGHPSGGRCFRRWFIGHRRIRGRIIRWGWHRRRRSNRRWRRAVSYRRFHSSRRRAIHRVSTVVLHKTNRVCLYYSPGTPIFIIPLACISSLSFLWWIVRTIISSSHSSKSSHNFANPSLRYFETWNLYLVPFILDRKISVEKFIEILESC